jgi:7,8-dihydroneopterin 2',3'-cyclic phosphate phosphodiesterase
MAELESLVEAIEKEDLKKHVRELLAVQDIDFDCVKLAFDEAPAGAYVHHAYKGGLLQHTLAVASLCLTMCDMVERYYGGDVDRDIVLAGALIHDVMKCYQYTPEGEKRFRTSALGERIDHLTLLVTEMCKRGMSLDLIHVVASHHGDQSPVKPKTLEALIVSIADLADSEFSRQSLRAAEYLVRETTGRREFFNSSERALELLRLKAKEGWDGVRRFNSEKSK